METELLVRYDDADVLDEPSLVREGDDRPGAFFYLLGAEGDGPDGWKRTRRVYCAPSAVVEFVQAFGRFEVEPAMRQPITEVFVLAADILSLVEVDDGDYPYDGEEPLP